MSYLLINNRGGETMKEKLPKVYVNKFEKKFINSREVVDVKKDKMDLDKLMAKNQYAFNHRYQILTKDKVIESSIISKDKNYILTIDGDWIKVDDIRDIKEIKK